MDEATRDLILWVVLVGGAICTIIAVVVRLMLVPYLREHLIEPMHEVKKQVSENHHSNDQPTVLDRIDDVQRDVATLSSVLSGHIESGDRWIDLFEREIDLVRREAGLKARDR